MLNKRVIVERKRQLLKDRVDITSLPMLNENDEEGEAERPTADLLATEMLRAEALQRDRKLDVHKHKTGVMAQRAKRRV